MRHDLCPTNPVERCEPIRTQPGTPRPIPKEDRLLLQTGSRASAVAMLNGPDPAAETYDTAMALLAIQRHLMMLHMHPENERDDPTEQPRVRHLHVAFVRRLVEPMREKLRQRGIETPSPEYA